MGAEHLEMPTLQCGFHRLFKVGLERGNVFSSWAALGFLSRLAFSRLPVVCLGGVFFVCPLLRVRCLNLLVDAFASDLES